MRRFAHDYATDAVADEFVRGLEKLIARRRDVWHLGRDLDEIYPCIDEVSAHIKSYLETGPFRVRSRGLKQEKLSVVVKSFEGEDIGDALDELELTTNAFTASLLVLLLIAERIKLQIGRGETAAVLTAFAFFTRVAILRDGVSHLVVERGRRHLAGSQEAVRRRKEGLAANEEMWRKVEKYAQEQWAFDSSRAATTLSKIIQKWAKKEFGKELNVRTIRYRIADLNPRKRKKSGKDLLIAK